MKPNIPRLIAWEMTKECELSCEHCRISPENYCSNNDLTTQEAKTILSSVAAHFKPIIIMTGGDPLLRKDFGELAEFGTSLRLTMVVASCGFGITREMAKRMKNAGVAAVSFSIDGEDEASHDAFRKTQGSFGKIMEAAAILRQMDIRFQINMTVTKQNVHSIDKVFRIAKDIGAAQFHPFLFVPTGAGRQISKHSLTSEGYENVLTHIYELSKKEKTISFNPTCAPQYNRIVLQYDEGADRKHLAGGCMGGKSFAFISSTGEVKACGFLDVVAGNLRGQDLDFYKVWEQSKLFLQLRNFCEYNGKCGFCRYRGVCGGCRARAYEVLEDYLGEEPYCEYDGKG